MSLLWAIEHHLRVSGMSATRFGRVAVNDAALVHDIRLGREPRPKMEERLRAFIAAAEEKGR